jgi:hypothetical protein
MPPNPGLCTGVSIGGGVLLALLSLWLFKRSSVGMVHFAVGLQVGDAASAVVVGGWGEAVP